MPDRGTLKTADNAVCGIPAVGAYVCGEGLKMARRAVAPPAYCQGHPPLPHWGNPGPNMGNSYIMTG